MANKNISFIITTILLFSLFIILNASNVNAYLAPIPEVGPGVCAWKQADGRTPCDERTQRCDKGCPPRSVYSGSGSSSGTSVSESSVPSIPQASASSCKESSSAISSNCNRAISSCVSICTKQKGANKELFQVCFNKCLYSTISTIYNKCTNKKKLYEKCVLILESSSSSGGSYKYVTDGSNKYGSMSKCDDKDVDFNKLNKEILSQIDMINNLFLSETGKTTCATSGFREAKPGDAFSYHQEGNAIDVRITDIQFRDQIKIFKKLRQRLGANYDVCLELKDATEAKNELGSGPCVMGGREPHIHIEFDRKRARKSPELQTNTEKPTLTKISGTKVTPTKITGTQITPSKVIDTKVTPTKITGTQITPSKVTDTKVTPTKVTGTSITPTKVTGTVTARAILMNKKSK